MAKNKLCVLKTKLLSGDGPREPNSQRFVLTGKTLAAKSYCCCKGLKIAHYQHHEDRLKPSPHGAWANTSKRYHGTRHRTRLRKSSNRQWGLRGPAALAYTGGVGEGCHFEAAFGVRLLRALGSHPPITFTTLLAQELTGGSPGGGKSVRARVLGSIPDAKHTNMLLAVGWNGWMSHPIPQARRHLKRIPKTPISCWW